MAINCIQVPIKDTAWPKKNRRKFLEPRARTINRRPLVGLAMDEFRCFTGSCLSNGCLHYYLFRTALGGKYSMRSEARACGQRASTLFRARGQTAGFQVRQRDGDNDRLRAIIFQIAD